MFTPHISRNLVKLGRLFATARSLQLTTASKYAAGSATFLPSLKSGECTVTERRAVRVTQWFSDNWPTDLPWPLDIPRPDPAPGSPAALAAAETVIPPEDAA